MVTKLHTTGQYVALAAALATSSLMSIICSILIIIQVKKDLKKVYHRILLMICLGDLAMSMSNIIHPYLLDSERTTAPYAIGNTASCSVMGFFLYGPFIFLSIHSSFLSISFLLQIRFKWTEDQVRKWAETTFHIFATTVGLGIPIAAIATQGMTTSEQIGLCLMIAYPHGCIIDDDIECERGEITETYVAPIQSYTTYFFGLLGFTCTFILYRTVRSITLQSERHTFGGDESALDDSKKKRLRLVSRQCVMYALAYFNTILWPGVTQLILTFIDFDEHKGEFGIFALKFVAFLFYPLQGFFNFIIFIMPRYQQWRRALPDEPWMYVLRCSISSRDVPKARGVGSRIGSIRSQYTSEVSQKFTYSRPVSGRSHASEPFRVTRHAAQALSPSAAKHKECSSPNRPSRETEPGASTAEEEEKESNTTDREHEETSDSVSPTEALDDSQQSTNETRT